MAYNITYKLVKIVHICIINFGYILTLDILTLDILTLDILTLVILTLVILTLVIY